MIIRDRINLRGADFIDVIPAKAGIQWFIAPIALDSGSRFARPE